MQFTSDTLPSTDFNTMIIVLLALCCLAAAAGAKPASYGVGQHPVHYWDILMDNPHGAAVTCLGSPGANPANSAGWSCTGSTPVPVGTVCTATCPDGGGPVIARCGDNGQWTQNGAQCLAPSCFSGNSKVVIKEADEPVAIRDLRIGDHVLCVDGGDDLMTPGSGHWCPVMNFARAEEAVFQDMVRINFTAANGTKGSTTISFGHQLHVMSNTASSLPQGNVSQLGPYIAIHAMHARPGQQLPAATTSDVNARFTTVVIDSVEAVNATGKYIPVIAHPYLLVDGVVAPLWTTFWDIQFTGAAVADAPDRYHAINALRHILHAPVWTQRLQAKGTPGRLATWGGNPRAPAMKFFSEAWTTFITNGTGIASGVANMTKALEWFRPRYDAFKADPSKAITFDDVAAVWPQLFEDGAGLSPAGQASLDTTSSGNPTTPAVCNDGLSLADPDGGLLPSCTLAETFTYR